MKESLAKLLEDTTFFVDRSSGKQIADALKELGLNIEKHDDHFQQDTLDIEWISKCGEINWVVISSDKAIKKNALERKALLNAGIAAFFFTSAELTSQQQIEILTKGLKQITNKVLHTKRPFIARLAKNGRVEIWLNHRGEDLILKKQKRRELKNKNKVKN